MKKKRGCFLVCIFQICFSLTILVCILSSSGPCPIRSGWQQQSDRDGRQTTEGAPVPMGHCGRWVFIICMFYTPPDGVQHQAYAKNKVPCAQTPDISTVSSFRPGVGQNVALCALLAAMNLAISCFCFPGSFEYTFHLARFFCKQKR